MSAPKKVYALVDTALDVVLLASENLADMKDALEEETDKIYVYTLEGEVTE